MTAIGDRVTVLCQRLGSTTVIPRRGQVMGEIKGRPFWRVLRDDCWGTTEVHKRMVVTENIEAFNARVDAQRRA